MSDKTKDLLQRLFFYGSLTIVSGYILFAIIQTKNLPDNDDPSFYDTNRIEDMNYDELEDYNEWKQKQRDKEIGKTKIYD